MAGQDNHDDDDSDSDDAPKEFTLSQKQGTVLERGSDGEEARAGDGEGEGGALGKGAVEGGDFLLADVIAAVTLRQHPRSDGAIVIQAGAPAPEGEEEARAIMRATLSFRLR
ncbi:unnamed protein product [Closterium sp. NIES-64]|nr:unnamed protein product [Closterium sp. NIES-64]